MTRQDKAYSFAKHALIGSGIGAATGILAKGIHNRSKGEGFFKESGKAALVGGGVGALAGGIHGHLKDTKKSSIELLPKDKKPKDKKKKDVKTEIPVTHTKQPVHPSHDINHFRKMLNDPNTPLELDF
jgi:hypothetical protein